MILDPYDLTRCLIPSHALALHYHRLERQQLTAGRPPGSVTGGWRRRLARLVAKKTPRSPDPA